MSRTQLLSIQVGLPQAYTNAEATGSEPATWTTAFLKQPVTGPVRVSRTNIEGDRAGAKTHGGADKVVCVYAWEHYAYWRRELNLPELVYGAFAENFTVQGQLEDQACIGDTMRAGEVELQLSQPRPPCWRLSRWWQRKEFAARMEETGLTGWYCRVIKEGHVEAGAKIELLERPHPEWTVSLANHLLYGNSGALDQMWALAACEPLAESWRELLSARVRKLTKSN
jgi:MOSC domain-containing protein YiiM